MGSVLVGQIHKVVMGLNLKKMKHLEIKTYPFNGVNVQVSIDYDAGTISLTEGRTNPKKWVFAERQIEYMAGWQNILDAMKNAVTLAEGELEKHQKEQEKEFAKKVVGFERAIKEHGKEAKKK